ncbi:hypothetical protein [Cochlodiniinecator piscidefendens]|uniref:hypothetical protein n=1 Tax=Cochlodiniinecator piscidefendens TaxID=2715756 RepID=UPI00140960A0|nr:hypothetical protein [Cochlodiniinecator piscidefendens]
MCDTKGCIEYRKSFRKEKLEGEFELLLKDMRPSANLFSMAFDMFRDLWQARLQSAEDEKQSMQKQLPQMDRKSAQILDRSIDTNSDTLISTYEERLREIEEQKTFLTEKIQKCGKLIAPFDQAYRTAFDFLGNPSKLWASERFEDKRAVLKLVLAERLPYTRNEGYRTAQTSLLFKALEDFCQGKFEMVPRGGIEPPTRGFSIFLGFHSNLCRAFQPIAKSVYLQLLVTSRANQTNPPHFIQAHEFLHP